jgi:hypothetical protein
MGRQSGAPLCTAGCGFMTGNRCSSSLSAASSAGFSGCGGGDGVTEGVGDGVGVPVSGSAVSKLAMPWVFPEGSLRPIRLQCGLILPHFETETVTTVQSNELVFLYRRKRK